MRLYKRMLKIVVGARQERQRHELMYLKDVTPGRLLEIGCGSGKRLSRLAALGWQVEGQEVDKKAWHAATTKYALKVHLGELRELALDESSYDAIVLNHVIEHVHDPVELLHEARRLLKPGGMLIANTPNAMSQEHRIFGAAWFSLDPPRHLHLFSPKSLITLARSAGFTQYETWTSSVNSDYVAAASLKILGLGDMKTPESKIAKEKRILAGLYFQLWAMRSHSRLPDGGEECTLRAIK
jgi:SAM-dependent methyltransferase